MDGRIDTRGLPLWSWVLDATVIKTKEGKTWQEIRWYRDANWVEVWRVSGVWTDLGWVNVSKYTRPEYGQEVPFLFREGTHLVFVMDNGNHNKRGFARFWLPISDATERPLVELVPANYLELIPSWKLRTPEPTFQPEHVEPNYRKRHLRVKQ